jgi:hypothetical protein
MISRKWQKVVEKQHGLMKKIKGEEFHADNKYLAGRRRHPE